MKQYKDLLQKILDDGNIRDERTGTGTISIFGPQLEFDLRDGFPAVTTKKLAIRLVWTELLWMIQGTDSLRPLLQANNHIWNDWPFKRWAEETFDAKFLASLTEQDNKDLMALFVNKVLTDDEFEEQYGRLGRIYGVQWRDFTGQGNNVDQLQNTIDKILSNPHDRRMVITAWNPAEQADAALPPCHILYQVYVEGDYVDMKAYQRSADAFLGLPFDIASYASQLAMIAHITGKTPRMLYYTLGDTHIYLNHIEQVKEQLTRPPYPLPTLNVNSQDREITSIDDFRIEDFSLSNYQHHASLKGKVSV